MADMMYRLVLRAQFENQEQLQSAIDGLEKLKVQGANVSVTMGAAGTTGKSSLEGIARSAMSVGFMFNMLESAMMRAQMATLLVDNAQDRYNTTVEKYGKNSAEARKAAKELASQMDYLNMATIRENVSMGLMIGMITIQSGVLNTATLAKIAHTAATAAQTAANWLENSSLMAQITLQAALHPWLVPAMVGGAAAVIGTVGYEIQQSMPQQVPKTETTVTITDQDIIRDYMRRTGGTSIKSAG